MHVITIDHPNHFLFQNGASFLDGFKSSLEVKDINQKISRAPRYKYRFLKPSQKIVDLLKFHGGSTWVFCPKNQEFRGASLRADVGELQRNMNHLEQVLGHPADREHAGWLDHVSYGKNDEMFHKQQGEGRLNTNQIKKWLQYS